MSGRSALVRAQTSGEMNLDSAPRMSRVGTFNDVNAASKFSRMPFAVSTIAAESASGRQPPSTCR